MRNKETPLESYTFGKVAPQALPLEEAVIGALLLDRDCVGIVSEVLRPDDFYLTAHQEIYRAILKLSGLSKPVDMLTVTEELRKTGQLETIGGSYYIVELTGRVASSANVEYHARIVLQKSVERKLISVCSAAMKDAYEGATDTFELLARAEKDIFSIYDATKINTTGHISAGALEALKTVERAMDAPDGVTGVPSGIYAVDRITGGWQNTDLIILAARPGMGKTAFAMTVAANAAKMGFPIGVFSLEMSSEQLSHRLNSAEAGIEGMKARNGKISAGEFDHYALAVQRVAELPIYISDEAAQTIYQIHAGARRMVAKHGIKLIIVDYLQLVRDTDVKGNREQEISAVARGLKRIAKDLKTPVIALSQLSRAVEARGGSKRPQLSDLRESGSIEQEADLVAFLYRPEYYQILEDENGQSLKGVAEIIWAKNRHGRVGMELMRFEESVARFSDIPANVQMPTGGQFTDFISPKRQEPDEDMPF